MAWIISSSMINFTIHKSLVYSILKCLAYSVLKWKKWKNFVMTAIPIFRSLPWIVHMNGRYFFYLGKGSHWFGTMPSLSNYTTKALSHNQFFPKRPQTIMVCLYIYIYIYIHLNTTINALLSGSIIVYSNQVQ